MIFKDKYLVPLDDGYREMLGFMISIAVIFIIGALSLAIYKDYICKSHVSEIFSHVTAMKVHFHERYALNNVFPNSEEIHTYLADSDGMTLESYETFADESIGVTGVAITVGIKSDLQEIDGDTVTYTALKDSSKGVLVWLCGYALHQDYAFDNTHNRTTLKRNYLPEICRD